MDKLEQLKSAEGLQHVTSKTGSRSGTYKESELRGKASGASLAFSKEESNAPSYKLRTRKIEEYELFEDQPEFKAEVENLEFKYDHLQPNRLTDLEKSGANALWHGKTQTATPTPELTSGEFGLRSYKDLSLQSPKVYENLQTLKTYHNEVVSSQVASAARVVNK